MSTDRSRVPDGGRTRRPESVWPTLHRSQGAQGETVALILSERLREAAVDIVAAARAATPQRIRSRQVGEDRIVAVGGPAWPARRRADRAVVVSVAGQRIEPLRRRAMRLASCGARIDVASVTALPLDPVELARVGRYVAGTRLGLAFGAGGALGHAHVGVIEVLQAAGYAIDVVGGSSIGALVAALHATCRTPGQLSAAIEDALPAEAAADLRLPGVAAGARRQRMLASLCRVSGDRRIEALTLPLVVMAVDLDAGEPAPLRAGPLGAALAGATAIPGLFPPVRCGGRRLADAVSVVPVPTAAVAAAGADVVVAVDLLGGTPPPVTERDVPRLLATLTAMTELQQRVASRRDAEAADVTVTPHFGSGTWRDFGRGDAFRAAGRRAARTQLPSLRELAHPTNPKGTA